MSRTNFEKTNNNLDEEHPRPGKNQIECYLLPGILALLFIAGCTTADPEDREIRVDFDQGTEVTSDPRIDTELQDTAIYFDTETDTEAKTDSDTDTAEDECPDDPRKNSPGQCGCGKTDNDSDGDGVANCLDVCPSDPLKTTLGQCGCGVPDPDSDDDGTADCKDYCPTDPNKTRPNACGCGISDDDRDGDNTPDCNDKCPEDPTKIDPGLCGCGVTDAAADSDGDGLRDCDDECPFDPKKIAPRVCGCGVEEDNSDSDKDGVWDCNDDCPFDPNKTQPLVCGCGAADTDSDKDSVLDCIDACPDDANKSSAGICGCGVADTDSDGDGVPDCNESLVDYVEGLVRTHLLDRDGDGVCETEVCNDLTHLWSEDTQLSIRDRGFGFSYPEGVTPCEEIAPFDKWISVFEGFLYLSTIEGTPSTHDVGFNADVNDGVRLVLRDPKNKVAICIMELWQDVPEYDNYHSTDAYEIDYGCESTLTAGVYYPMKLEVYHESDPDSSNYLFNRAHLSMFYRRVPTGGSIKFYRAVE